MAAIDKICPDASGLLLIPENHTRNTFYLQNVARLAAILRFAHTLTTDPVKADKAALLRLKESGLSTPEIVTLAQLIAFISYQTRVVAGLRAMQKAEARA